MMAQMMKSLVLAALFVAVFAAGQVPRGAGLGVNVNPAVNTSAIISGVVPCSTGSSTNVATVPAVFPNAAVQLMCGGKVVAGATADASGAFVISLSSVSKELCASLLGTQCQMAVATPLSACDKSLAGVTGTLTAPLKLLGISTGSGSSDPLGLGGIIGVVTEIINGIIGGILNLGTQSFTLV